MQVIEHCLDYREDKLKGGDAFENLLELGSAISEAAAREREEKRRGGHSG